ncbi:hypothetical protein [Rhodococcus opacus]|uniref:hypothetical protein n=1 Tax=Rhodococcus opacus TaxID=37919 RepID=UPI00155AF2C3|nr:hypothetical protein [Rhodococcus opacus]
MRALVLELVGAFSITQETVVRVAEIYFEKRTPGLAEFVKKKALDRIGDDERPKLVLTLGEELKTTSDLANFGRVFRNVKKVRDFIAHASRVELIDRDTVRLVRTIHVSAAEPESPTMTLTRQAVADRMRDAQWLTQHVNFLLVQSDLVVKTYQGDREVRFLEPTVRPEEWDGVLFELVESEA